MRLVNAVLVLAGLVIVTTGVLAQDVTGSGAANVVPKFTSGTTLGNSAITELNGNVGIGTTIPLNSLEVAGNIKGAILSSNRSPVGLEHNMLFSAISRYTVSQSGPATLNLTTLFDGYKEPTYSTNPPLATNPQTILVQGLPAMHTQAGAWVGWSTRFWAPTKFKIEGYDVYGGYNNWRTIADYSSTPYSGLDFMVQVPVGGAYTQLRLTIYAADGVNGNVGLSELFFIEPEATQPYSGLPIIFPDGSKQTTAWTGVLCGGDYAESVDVSGDRTHYEPGDVLVIDSDNPGNFAKSAEPYSTAVTGIYSTKPGVVGRRQPTENRPIEVPMAMVGIVPAKVSAENGPIRPGDILVTSSTPGHAMKGTNRGLLTGAVVGKALGSLNSGTGVIEVVVSLQ